MIKIPTSSKKHTVSNDSDLFGTIHYGKNINLDEKGYVKLSSRTVSLYSEIDDTSVRLPLAFGRGSLFSTSTDFAITQSGQKGYWATLAETGITFNTDIGTNAPTLSVDSHGKWFHNLWVVTSDTDFFTKADLTDTATYTDRGNLTSGKAHPIEVFRNRDQICFGDGNTVKMYSESGGTFTLVTTLTLPADFEVVGLAYSNNKMGIITMLNDSNVSSGQNQDAYFFVWDGSTTSANQGVPIGADKTISITAYKGSWVILTRAGQLKFYNGGGWQDLTSLPLYYKNLIWGQSFTRDILGDVMLVDGDRIYLNVNAIVNQSGQKYQQFYNDNIGGVLCYDPNVLGVYQRYSPSISPAKLIAVTSANVNTTTDLFTTSSTVPSTGSPVKYISDKTNQIGGLETANIYFVIKVSSTTFRLAETKEKAQAGDYINITSTGASNNYFLGLEVYDYGASFSTKSGAMAKIGKYLTIHDDIIFGAELNDATTTGNSNHFMVTIPDFDNKGYYVLPKIFSDQVTDDNQKIFVKYRPLKERDRIVVKAKKEELIGLPVSTPQGRISNYNQCSWLGLNIMSTTADLSDALTAFNNGKILECEIIAGAGAGSASKIESMTEENGVYSIVLQDNIDGATSGRYCDILIDNFEEIGVVDTNDTEGYKELLIGSTSSFIKFKIWLEGVDTTVEELQFINSIKQKSA